MFSWLRSKCSHEEEYYTLRKRIVDLAARVDELDLNQDNMRNMARKIQKARKVQEEDEPEDSKAMVILPV